MQQFIHSVILAAIFALPLAACSQSESSSSSQTAANAYLIIDATAAAELVAKDWQLVDVRSLREWQSGHLEHAIHLPLTQLLAANAAEQAASALVNKAQPLLLYCVAGVRAERAAQELQQLGYQQLHVVAPGGYRQLLAAGLNN